MQARREAVTACATNKLVLGNDTIMPKQTTMPMRGYLGGILRQ